MTAHRSFGMTSRPSATGISHSTGSRSAGTQTYPHAEIRLPSGSLDRAIGPFEPLDLSQARLNEALALALPLSIILWILIGLSVWGLISVFF
ncbi:hypothetical protein ABIB87_008899 [Bradyrhizobium sp. JR18.2]